jgi:hypothetical protein
MRLIAVYVYVVVVRAGGELWTDLVMSDGLERTDGDGDGPSNEALIRNGDSPIRDSPRVKSCSRRKSACCVLRAACCVVFASRDCLTDFVVLLWLSRGATLRDDMEQENTSGACVSLVSEEWIVGVAEWESERCALSFCHRAKAGSTCAGRVGQSRVNYKWDNVDDVCEQRASG